MTFSWEPIENNLLTIILGLVWSVSLWEFYLNHRQRKIELKLTEIPSSVSNFMTKDVYEKSRLYGLDKGYYSDVTGAVALVLNTLILVFPAFHYAWDKSEKACASFGIHNDLATSAVTMIFINVVNAVINLPFSIYSTFVLEEKHGFNKQTARFYIRDKSLQFLVAQGIGVPFLCAMIWIVENSGDYLVWYLWGFTVAVTIFMMIIYPEVIAPIFDKYSPLDEGDLKTKIEALASSLKFPLYKLYVVEGSKRSSHSNAYLYGFYKYKRIVLFDTLIKGYSKSEDEKDKNKGCDTEEILGVLAHELGHWKFNHTFLGFLLMQVNILMIFIPIKFLLTWKAMYQTFGFYNSQPTFIGLLILMMYILIPFHTIMKFVGKVMVRRFEFQADDFAKQLGYKDSIKSALLKLQEDNLSFPVFDNLYSAWHHDHPTILERIDILDKDD